MSSAVTRPIIQFLLPAYSLVFVVLAAVSAWGSTKFVEMPVKVPLVLATVYGLLIAMLMLLAFVQTMRKSDDAAKWVRFTLVATVPAGGLGVLFGVLVIWLGFDSAKDWPGFANIAVFIGVVSILGALGHLAMCWLLLKRVDVEAVLEELG